MTTTDQDYRQHPLINQGPCIDCGLWSIRRYIRLFKVALCASCYAARLEPSLEPCEFCGRVDDHDHNDSGVFP